MTHIPGHRGINGTAGIGAGTGSIGGRGGGGGGPGFTGGGPVGGIDDRTRGNPEGGGFWEWVQNNQEVATGILGTGVEAYGAYKEGKAVDRQFEQDKLEYEEAVQREEDRRERRRAAYDQILKDRRKAY